MESLAYRFHAQCGLAVVGEGRGRCLLLRQQKPGSGLLTVGSTSSFRSSHVSKDEGSYYVLGEGAKKVQLTTHPKTSQWGTMGNEKDERIDELVREIKQMFQSMNDGETSPSAYDTAWVAMVPSIDDKNKPQFPETHEWILKNQNEDGSWGEPSFFLLYDRLVCTLSCVLTLKKWAIGEDYAVRGLQFLSTHTQQLGKETTGLITCGFEIIFPSMLNQARNLGVDLPYNLPYLKEITKLREKKMNRIPLEVMHSVHTTLLYSLEALDEVVQWDKIIKLQSRDGSFLSSPSATAAAYMKTGDKKCLKFLTYIVNRFGDHAPCHYPIDLLERIWAVDTIQRLGIHHHFLQEISDALDYVYRHAGKRRVSWGRDNPVADVDDTCMALRLLRLQGYPISSDVLEHFRDKDGNFVCFPGETHRGVSDMFNLYRFSQIPFPGEKILREANTFTEQYLKSCVEKNEVEDKWSLKKALHNEVDHALRYPWKMSLQRLEAKKYIDQYGEDDVWIAKTIYWMYNVNSPKYLELAKLDYNKLQTIHIKETNSIMKWYWKNLGSQNSRISPKEIHFSIAATIYEPEFSACRIAYTKLNCIEDVLKELFESHESINNLRLFCQAVEEWNPALICSLPAEVKLSFMVMYDTLINLASEAKNAQGKDMFPYLHGIRLMQIQEYIGNREKGKNQNVISLKEHLEYDKKQVGLAIRLVPSMLLMGNHLDDHTLSYLDHRSNIHDNLSLLISLLQDIHTYKNAGNVETTTAIHMLMKEEEHTEEEAVDHVRGLIDNIFVELVQEYLKPSHTPYCCRRLLFEHARIAHFFFNEDMDQNLTLVNDAMECLFTPVQ